MMNKLLIIIFNRVNKYRSEILTFYYRHLFSKAGSVRVWGRINVTYPQNIIIGNKCSINHGVFLNAYNPIVIGDNVTLSANTMLISTGIDLKQWIAKGSGDKHTRNEGIHIGNNVWIGAGSLILGGVFLTGENVIVAAGSVVTKPFSESNVIIGGCPAKIIKRIE